MGKGYVFKGNNVTIVREIALQFRQRLLDAGRRVQQPFYYNQDGQPHVVIDVCGKPTEGTDKLYQELYSRLKERDDNAR